MQLTIPIYQLCARRKFDLDESRIETVSGGGLYLTRLATGKYNFFAVTGILTYESGFSRVHMEMSDLGISACMAGRCGTNFFSICISFCSARPAACAALPPSIQSRVPSKGRAYSASPPFSIIIETHADFGSDVLRNHSRQRSIEIKPEA